MLPSLLCTSAPWDHLPNKLFVLKSLSQKLFLRKPKLEIFCILEKIFRVDHHIYLLNLAWYRNLGCKSFCESWNHIVPLYFSFHYFWKTEHYSDSWSFAYRTWVFFLSGTCRSFSLFPVFQNFIILCSSVSPLFFFF